MWYYDAWRLSVSISYVVRNKDVCNWFSTWFFVTHFEWALIIFHWSFTWFLISYGSNLEADLEKVTFDTKTNVFFQIWIKFLQECACLSGTITTTIRVFISTHNFLTISSQCESQCEKNSAHIVTHNIRWHRNYSHNIFTFCLRKKEFLRKKNSSMEKTS